MNTKHVIVVPYDEKWKQDFIDIKSEIQEALGELALSIEHVGSTSVEGLSLKDAYSLLAESQLARGDSEKALVTAGKAQSAPPGSTRAEARTLFLLAFLYLNLEKRKY